MHAREPIEILLIEDNPGDARLVQEALKDAKVKNRVTHAKDGQEALDRLTNPAFPRPDLILLDMILPRKDGRAVLEALKSDPALRQIPILVLSALKEEKDVHSAYDLHANAYVNKPVTYDEMGQVVDAVDAFWMNVARLPARDAKHG